MEYQEKKIHIKLPDELHKKLRLKCAYDNLSMQEYVESLIHEDLADYEAILIRPKKKR